MRCELSNAFLLRKLPLIKTRNRTSAYTTDDGSFVTVAIVQTSQEWKQFATLLGENGYDSKYVTVFIFSCLAF